MIQRNDRILYFRIVKIFRKAKSLQPGRTASSLWHKQSFWKPIPRLLLLSQSNTDFESKSTFIKYETLDGNKISYDVFKLIQCKRPLLSQYEYNFKWSGTHLPKITSELQKVENILDRKDSSIYDKAILNCKSIESF